MKIVMLCVLLHCYRVAKARTHNHSKESLRIIGGIDVETDQYPWVVALGFLFKGKMIRTCSGSLISPEWVLTAAHCVGCTHIYIRGDEDDGAASEQRHKKILQSVPHSTYFYNNFASQIVNDIAFLKVSPTKIASYGKVNAIDYGSLSGLEVKIVGYGLREFQRDYVTPKDDDKPVLKYAKGLLTKCNQHPGLSFVGHALCVMRECAVAGLAIYGDSGGPLVLDNDTVVGVISFVDSYGRIQGYYSHVDSVATYAMPVSPHLDWISKLTSGSSARR